MQWCLFLLTSASLAVLLKECSLYPLGNVVRASTPQKGSSGTSISYSVGLHQGQVSKSHSSKLSRLALGVLAKTLNPESVSSPHVNEFKPTQHLCSSRLIASGPLCSRFWQYILVSSCRPFTSLPRLYVSFKAIASQLQTYFLYSAGTGVLQTNFSFASSFSVRICQ